MTKKMSMVQCSIKEETDEAGSHLWWLIQGSQIVLCNHRDHDSLTRGT